jgi:hypothetical protein
LIIVILHHQTNPDRYHLANAIATRRLLPHSLNTAAHSTPRSNPTLQSAYTPA